MNRADFDKLVNDTMAATAGILIAKGAEYAGDGDRLANFKRNAEKQSTTSLQIWKQYYSKHADSIDTYFKRVNDKAIKHAMNCVREEAKDADEAISADEFIRVMNCGLPNAIRDIDKTLSEPIEGRFHDIINYCLLGIALLREVRNDAEKAS